MLNRRVLVFSLFILGFIWGVMLAALLKSGGDREAVAPALRICILGAFVDFNYTRCLSHENLFGINTHFKAKNHTWSTGELCWQDAAVGEGPPLPWAAPWNSVVRPCFLQDTFQSGCSQKVNMETLFPSLHRHLA